MVREIRNDEFEGTYKEDNDRHRAVHKGDMVIMTSRYAVPNEIRGRIFKVMEEPRYKRDKKGRPFLSFDRMTADARYASISFSSPVSGFPKLCVP